MINRATCSGQGSLKASSDARAKLRLYCKDIDRWAESWAGFPDLDVPVGERIVAEFTPFLLAVIAERRTKKTGLFSGISGCHLALSADQELIEPPTHRVVNRVFLFITRMAPQGPTRLIDVF